jgi:phosphopantothenoylcysteine decarboxylase/phosphopantothenate--cysteine ligase
MKILLGVPGGIAAYKAIEFTRLAVKAGHSVRVIQTPASLRFVGRASFAAITGAPVLASEFESDPANGAWPGEDPRGHTPISHLALIEDADIFVVAPATANTLARLAAGSAEDLVSTSALAATCPVVLAPAMNNLMWENEATVTNVERLRSRGFEVLDPTEGLLASKGEAGRGRLVEPAELLLATEGIGGTASGSSSAPLAGLKFLVSAGGTREPIDEVRYIGNRSSGRMGVAIAEVAAQMGASVTLVGANLSVNPSPPVNLVEVSTAAQMHEALEAEFNGCDVLVMAAAVADFIPVKSESGKIDKSDGIPEIELTPATDILATLAGSKTASQTLVGFAAEHGAALERAESKRVRKGLDMVVFNDISDKSIGFDSAENEVVLLTAEGQSQLPKADKREVARGILAAVAEMRTS